jgi:hypothetical protein
MWGIWNSLKKEWQFGIREATQRAAKTKLFAKIGTDAFKWRFEVRRIEGVRKEVH